MIFTLKKYLFCAQTTKRYMSNNQTLCSASGLKRNPCSVTSLYLGARYKSPPGVKLSVNHSKRHLYKATNLFEAATYPFSKDPCFQCGHSKWDTRKKIVQWQRFLTAKDSQVFCKQTNKNKDWTVQLMWTLNHLNLLNLSGNNSQIYECCWSICKTTWDSFVFRKRWDWTVFFQVSRFESLHCNTVWTSIILPLLCLCSKSFDQGCWLLYLTFDMHLLYFWGHNQRIMSNASFVKPGGDSSERWKMLSLLNEWITLCCINFVVPQMRNKENIQVLYSNVWTTTENPCTHKKIPFFELVKKLVGVGWFN